MATSTSLANLLDLNNELFKAYAFWSVVLVLKTLLMSLLTGLQRFKTRSFANPEDCLSKKDKVKYDEPDVERMRRAHRNDLENVFPFTVIAFFYMLTNPSTRLAINLFRAVGLSRIAHTIVYSIIVIPQPARVLSFGIAYAATIYMGLQVVFYIL